MQSQCYRVAKNRLRQKTSSEESSSSEDIVFVRRQTFCQKTSSVLTSSDRCQKTSTVLTSSDVFVRRRLLKNRLRQKTSTHVFWRLLQKTSTHVFWCQTTFSETSAGRQTAGVCLPHVRKALTWHIYVTWHMWHDTFIYVTWLIYICDMTHWYMWHDWFGYVAWLIHMCDMDVGQGTQLTSCMSCVYVWHDP